MLEFLTKIYDSAPLLLYSTLTSCLIWLLSSILSLIFGLSLAIFRSAKLRIPLFSYLLDIITLILRGIPLYAQLFIAYFLIPELTGINLSAFTIGTIALGLCSGAYASEIIRGGINSIAKGQWKAGFVLGYTTSEQLRFIILPQTLRSVLPSLINEYVMVLKSTPILASIGVIELTKAGTNIILRSANVVPIIISIATIYFFLTYFFSAIGELLERRYKC